MDATVLLLVLVALIWGMTNSMMKKGSEGIEKIKEASFFHNFIQEVAFLLRNWRYLSAYALNQMGSLLYYYALRHCDLALAGPITNTLTFLVTYWSGKLMYGEKDDSHSNLKMVGMMFVCAGVTVCLYDKLRIA